MERTCKKCREAKDKSSFPHYLPSTCRPCLAAMKRKRDEDLTAEQKAARVAYRKQYYDAHSTELIAYSCAYQRAKKTGGPEPILEAKRRRPVWDEAKRLAWLERKRVREKAIREKEVRTSEDGQAGG